MVQNVDHRFDHPLYLGVVDQPSHLLVALPGDGNLDPVGMTVESRTLVLETNLRQVMASIEFERTGQFYEHGLDSSFAIRPEDLVQLYLKSYRKSVPNDPFSQNTARQFRMDWGE